MASTLSEQDVKELNNIATRLRIHSIESTNVTKSGHPTSCSSSAEIMATLFFKIMRYNPKLPRDPNNDRFILSKGHAAPVLYAAWCEAGFIPEAELLKVRLIGSDLEGHPTPRLEFVDVATGSLGQGLSAGAGMAYVAKYVDASPVRVFCLIGDGESAEGSIWEAMSFASHYKLDNLVAIFDVNRLGQSEPTMFQHDVDVYRKRSEAFGFRTIVVDGHDVSQLFHALSSTGNSQPLAIVAKTFKGFDFPGISDLENFHGKSLASVGDAKNQQVLAHLRAKLPQPVTAAGDNKSALAPLPPANPQQLQDRYNLVGKENLRMSSPPKYTKGQKVATRLAYGTALAKLGEANPRVLGLDGDTKNSTFSIKLRDVRPGQYVECFIAEQNLVGVAIGAGTRDRTIPFASTFACFLTRAFDQIRMGAVSQSHCNFAGSHVGVSIGEDGPSQMGLEDLAMFRTVPNCVVFYPSDAVSAERAVELAANQPSMCFIRTSRPDAEVLYDNEEPFAIGQAKVVKSSGSDAVTIVAAGVTMTESLAAHEALAKEGISVRIIDPFTVKPIDKETLVAAARATGGRILTVEDHYYEGGLGEAVLSAVAEEPNVQVKRLAVASVARSGKPAELLRMVGIDASGIVAAVKALLAR